MRGLDLGGDIPCDLRLGFRLDREESLCSEKEESTASLLKVVCPLAEAGGRDFRSLEDDADGVGTGAEEGGKSADPLAAGGGMLA